MFAHHRVFVSAVTSEFGDLRTAIAYDLRPRGWDVRVQEEFELGGGTLLGKLRDYITSCQKIVCLVGHVFGAAPRSGGRDVLGPSSQLDKFRQYGGDTFGGDMMSYTQWEYLLARDDAARQTYVFLSPAAAAGSPDTRHHLFREWLTKTNRERRTLTSRAKLLRGIGNAFPPLPKPNNLPDFSTNTSFVGRKELLDTLRPTAVPGRHLGAGTINFLWRPAGAGKA